MEKIGTDSLSKRKRASQHVGRLLMGGAGVIFVPLPVGFPVSGFPVKSPRRHVAKQKA